MKTKIVINPRYQHLKEFIGNLPANFDNQGEVLFGGRNIIREILIGDLRLNVKSFKVPHLVNQLVYDNFRVSKARRSFEYANILQEKGINTPDPVAYLECKQGLRFMQSYYISIQEEFDGLMREFKTGELTGREDLLRQFAQFTANMHQKDVLHLDYSPGNILYKKEDQTYLFYLVDLNRMYFGDVSIDLGCKSFRRLWGNEEMIKFIASEYAKARNFNQDKCIELTLLYHKKFWEHFTKKHPDKTAYTQTLTTND